MRTAAKIGIEFKPGKTDFDPDPDFDRDDLIRHQNVSVLLSFELASDKVGSYIK